MPCDAWTSIHLDHCDVCYFVFLFFYIFLNVIMNLGSCVYTAWILISLCISKDMLKQKALLGDYKDYYRYCISHITHHLTINETIVDTFKVKSISSFVRDKSPRIDSCHKILQESKLILCKMRKCPVYNIHV